MSTSWTNGNGSKRVVKMNTTNSFTALGNGSSPTADTVWHNNGEQVIYNGTGSSVSVTGLTISTTYWFEVYEYNGSGTTIVYNNTTATNNPNSQSTSTAANNPTAQNLPFAFTSLTGSTLPAGMAVTSFSTLPTTRTNTAPLDNLRYSTTAQEGGWRDESSSGLSLLGSGSANTGALVVAINTTNKTHIQVSWKAGTILQQDYRDNSIALQYRVGTTGNFTDVGTTSTYNTSGKSAGDLSSLYLETLPSGAENQAVVQLRWIYWESNSTSGARDRINLTAITVNSIPTTQASNITFSNVNLNALTANWTNGNGTNRIVKMNTSNSFTTPTSGYAPTANATWANAGEQVVFNGSGSTVNIKNLVRGTTYWFRVYEYYGTASSTNYNVATATNNPNSQATLSCGTIVSRNGSGTWADTAHWTPSVVPIACDSVVITTSSPITIGANANAKSVDIQSGSTLTANKYLNVSSNLFIDGTLQLASNIQVGFLLTLNSGVLNGGTLSDTVFIGGNWSNSGIGGVFNPGNGTVFLLGTGAQTISKSTGTESFNNLVKAGTSVATLSCPLTCSGNLFVNNGTLTLGANLTVSGNNTIASAATLNSNNQNFTLGGNWTNNGIFTTGTGSVILNGNANQSLVKGSGAEALTNVTVNKASGNLVLNSPLAISANLTLTLGSVVTTSTNILKLSSAATVTGGSNTSYVSGPMDKIGNSAFTFPLGSTSLSSGAFHPLTITAPATATDEFVAQYLPAAQGFGSTLDDSLLIVSNCEYWLLSQLTGTDAVQITLGWNSNNCIGTAYADYRIGSWDGSVWRSKGQTALNHTGLTGTISSATTLLFSATATPLALGTYFHPLKMVSSTYDAYCRPSLLGSIYLNVTGGAAPLHYQWTTLSLSDSTPPPFPPSSAHPLVVYPGRDSIPAGVYQLVITDARNRTNTFTYNILNCVNWGVLPTGFIMDSLGNLTKSGGSGSWANSFVNSSKILAGITDGAWVQFTVADTASQYLFGFGSVPLDSIPNDVNYTVYVNNSNLIVVESDNDGFYSKKQIGNIVPGDVIKIQMSAVTGINYYKNGVPFYQSNLLSNVRLLYQSGIYNSGNTIGTIRCSTNR